MQAPVQRFGVEVTLDDPYWKSFRDELNAPDFNSFDPSVNDYLCDYDNKVSELHDMAFALARVMNPAARGDLGQRCRCRTGAGRRTGTGRRSRRGHGGGAAEVQDAAGYRRADRGGIRRQEKAAAGDLI